MGTERLWHGGAPGRAVGDVLLPPSESGLEYTRLEMSREGGLDQIGQRLDRVYMTTDKSVAKAYASLWTPDGEKHGGGCLYVVEADDLEPDDDLLSLPGFFQAPRATVVTVYDPHVAYDPKCGKVFDRVLADLAAAKAAATQ